MVWPIMVAQDSGCNVRDVKRQSQRGRHSEGRRKGKSRDCTISKALLTRWFKRVRAATLIFATFRPLFRLGGRWSASIPFDHAYCLLASCTKHVRLASRTKGCAPNASTVACSGEVRYPKFDFLFLQPDSPEIGMREPTSRT